LFCAHDDSPYRVSLARGGEGVHASSWSEASPSDHRKTPPDLSARCILARAARGWAMSWMQLNAITISNRSAGEDRHYTIRYFSAR
jgi:hypothetical protein